MIKQQVSKVFIIIGALFLVIGFSWSNPRLWMPGIILFSLGIFLHCLDFGDGDA